MKQIVTALSFTLLLSTSCNNKHNEMTHETSSIKEEQKREDTLIYESQNLIISKISKHVYEHTSFLNTDSFGKVSCNGMIVVDDDEAIVFDTPADEESSKELIDYLTNEIKIKIHSVIATHFHADCVAGLKEFHKRNVHSHASNLTISLLKQQKNKFDLPQNGFDNKLELKVGNKSIYAEYFGEGHTRDNIIGYFPYERIMFGGCLIKEHDAGKGNLEDANTDEWSKTVERVKQRYSQVDIVIPGHGKRGGRELIDYTISLFK